MAEQIPVRHIEGVTHGFLVLRTLDGTVIADGDLQQVLKAGRVTDTLTFRFKDSSYYEETTIFSQRGSFRLLHDRVVQRGPSFKDQQTDTSIDAATGQITIRQLNKDNKVSKQHLDLPADLSNGLLFIVLKNIDPAVSGTTVSFLATSSKSRLTKLHILPQGEENFEFGLFSYTAHHFLVKTEISGVAGAVAEVVGKQPPELQVWVLKSEAPVFVQFEGPLYQGGPVWRLELAKPEYSAH